MDAHAKTIYEEYMRQHATPSKAAVPNQNISTKADLIARVVLHYGKIELARISKILNLPAEVLEFYLESLEDDGMIRIKAGLLDRYAIATRKLIAQNRGDLVKFIDKKLQQNVPAKVIRQKLFEAGWKKPLLDSIIRNDTQYMPSYLTRV
jgi:hypothetical protein